MAETAPITIYGASDDLVEIAGAVSDEFDLPSSGEGRVLLTAPDFGTLVVNLGFCTANPDGWHVRVESHGDQTPPWPIHFHAAPRTKEGDPAVTIDAPIGTTVTEVSR